MNSSRSFFNYDSIFSLKELLNKLAKGGVISVLILISYHARSQSAQVFISEKWTGTGGESAVFYHNASSTDNQGNVYVVGSTLNANNNHDIIIQKFNRSGILLWQETFNGNADLEDMGADVFIDSNYNVYVTGVATETVQNGYDLIVLKYNSGGVLQWQYDYNNGGQPYPYDAGTAITGDNNGSILVTGGSFGATSMSDFVTIRLNSQTGSEVWSERYNYTDLSDIAAKIEYRNGRVYVSGGSQILVSPNKWELATLSYDLADGTLLDEKRTTGNSTAGVDEVHDLTTDEEGNVHIAGAVNNDTTGFDIRIYKLDDELNILWERDYDGNEGDDRLYGIKVNETGEIYATGYTTHPTQGRNIITFKLNSSSTVLWMREYNGLANGDDEGIQLVIDEEERIFVSGEVRNSENSDYIVIGYYSDGTIFGQATYNGSSDLDDRPTGMAIDLDGDIIVTGQTEEPGSYHRSLTVKYGIYEKQINPVYVDSIPYTMPTSC